VLNFGLRPNRGQARSYLSSDLSQNFRVQLRLLSKHLVKDFSLSGTTSPIVLPVDFGYFDTYQTFQSMTLSDIFFSRHVH